MAIVWTDEINVGIKSIDGQHMHLVDLIVGGRANKARDGRVNPASQ